jgi:hypothetical protein
MSMWTERVMIASQKNATLRAGTVLAQNDN